jgi:hypothetical protein
LSPFARYPYSNIPESASKPNSLRAGNHEAKEVRMQKKIRRNYRQSKSPAKALAFFKRVKRGLTDNSNFTDATWGTNITSRQEYFEAVDKFEDAYNLAINGDRLLISARDKLWQEIIVMLDEIASHLEAQAARTPEALLSSGFEVISERKMVSRSKTPLKASSDFRVENEGQRGKGIGKSSHIPGAFNHEIHATSKDPSVEENWSHKGIFNNPGNMEMNNLEAGNMFFRMRSHGPDGAGPWSTIVSTTIT